MGIRVPKAVGDFLILDAVRDSGGARFGGRRRGDRSRGGAMRRRDDGLLLCPEGGATLAAAALALDQGLVGADERVVLFNCATGLKYPLSPILGEGRGEGTSGRLARLKEEGPLPTLSQNGRGL
jgi:threonine synthase